MVILGSFQDKNFQILEDLKVLKDLLHGKLYIYIYIYVCVLIFINIQIIIICEFWING